MSRWTSASLAFFVLLAAGCSGLRRTGVEPLGPMPAPGPVYIESAEIIQLESYPVQVMLEVKGQLPDPCHSAAWKVSDPTADGRIDVTLSSQAPIDQACIQVLKPVVLRIPVGSFTQGSYAVWLNGQLVGKFSL